MTLEPHPQVTFQNLGSTTVLVHLETNRVYELNRTGARCWELLCEGCDQSEIKRRLFEEFDAAEVQLDDEIDQILKSLTSEKLLVKRHAE